MGQISEGTLEIPITQHIARSLWLIFTCEGLDLTTICGRLIITRMDDPNQSLSRTRRLRQLYVVFIIIRVVMMLHWLWYTMNITITRSTQLKEAKKDRKKLRIQILNRLSRENDVFCRNKLRMKMCSMYYLRCLVTLEVMFLYKLAHHKKNRSISHLFIGSGEGVSHHFNQAVLKLHEHLLAKPKPIGEDCQDGKWRCFKNCLGALDGSAHDGRVLRNALSRPDGLKDPKGNI
ncbi:hypothetical protein V2J09_021456 [Rumex salicifolius]